LIGAFAEPSFVISAKPTGNTLPQPVAPPAAAANTNVVPLRAQPARKPG